MTINDHLIATQVSNYVTMAPFSARRPPCAHLRSVHATASPDDDDSAIAYPGEREDLSRLHMLCTTLRGLGKRGRPGRVGAGLTLSLTTRL